MLDWQLCFWPNNKIDMIGSRIPRFLLYATTLGVIVAAIMLSMFYGQYRWLANQIVSTSSDEHRALVENNTVYDNGTTFDMSVFVSTYKFNEEIYVTAFLTDITEQKESTL